MKLAIGNGQWAMGWRLALLLLAWPLALGPWPCFAAEDGDASFRQLEGTIISGDDDTAGEYWLSVGDGTYVVLDVAAAESFAPLWETIDPGLIAPITANDAVEIVVSNAITTEPPALNLENNGTGYALRAQSAGLAAANFLGANHGILASTTSTANNEYGAIISPGDTSSAAVLLQGAIETLEIATPDNAESGTARAYPKSDGLWYGLDDAGVETKLSNDAGGGYNQLQEEGSNITQRTTLDFVGSAVTVADTGSISRATFDSDLNAVASNSTNGIYARTGAGTIAARTIAEGAAIDISNGDGVSGNPTIAVDLTEVDNATWSSAIGAVTHTFNTSGGTDPTVTYSDGVIGLNQALPTSGLHLGRSFATPLRRITATTTVTAADFHINGDPDNASGNFEADLPAASTCLGRIYVFSNMDWDASDADTYGVDPNSTETINGSSTTVLVTRTTPLVIQSDGSNWIRISGA